MSNRHYHLVINEKNHEIAYLKRRLAAFETLDSIDQFRAAINRARAAEAQVATLTEALEKISDKVVMNDGIYVGFREVEALGEIADKALAAYKEGK